MRQMRQARRKTASRRPIALILAGAVATLTLGIGVEREADAAEMIIPGRSGYADNPSYAHCFNSGYSARLAFSGGTGCPSNNRTAYWDAVIPADNTGGFDMSLKVYTSSNYTVDNTYGVSQYLRAYAFYDDATVASYVNFKCYGGLPVGSMCTTGFFVTDGTFLTAGGPVMILSNMLSGEYINSYVYERYDGT